jgi:hypothetical protein
MVVPLGAKAKAKGPSVAFMIAGGYYLKDGLWIAHDTHDTPPGWEGEAPLCMLMGRDPHAPVFVPDWLHQEAPRNT